MKRRRKGDRKPNKELRGKEGTGKRE